MKSYASVFIVALPLFTGAAARQFTVKNNCSYTIWPALFTDLSAGTAIPEQPTGWVAPSGDVQKFTVPDDWRSGRIWGRRDCNFNEPAPPLMCSSGGCNGGLLCDPRTGTGVPPATVAEFTLSTDPNVPDYYDVSLVDGFNIPISITNSVGCGVAQCSADLNQGCPQPLQKLGGSNGTDIVGCRSSCEANLDGNQADSGNCCSGSHDTPQTCPATGVQYYDHFKNAQTGCPDAYAYAYDEQSGNGQALWTCDSDLKADYVITFCPSN